MPVAVEMTAAIGQRLVAPPFRALSQYAAQAIREGIIVGRFPPGSRLIERDLANELEVSRVPVREGLLLLAREGFVSVVPHRGAVVSTVSPELVLDVFSLRAALEVLAARLVTPTLSQRDLTDLERLVEEMKDRGSADDHLLLVDQDIEFHRVLARSCGRPMLLEALAMIWNKTYLLIGVSRAAYPLDRIADLHAGVLHAMASRDPDRVEAALRQHLAFGQAILIEHLRSISPNVHPCQLEATAGIR